MKPVKVIDRWSKEEMMIQNKLYTHDGCEARRDLDMEKKKEEESREIVKVVPSNKGKP